MVYYNITFPIVDNLETNSFFKLSETSKSAYTSDLLLLLLTEKGTRYYEPNYGTNLIRFVFEQNDSNIFSDIQQEIKRAVSLYIPTLTINNIELEQNNDNEGSIIPENQLNIKVDFTYKEDSFTESGTLTISF
jgi:phage baseplate assembly protein W